MTPPAATPTPTLTGCQAAGIDVKALIAMVTPQTKRVKTYHKSADYYRLRKKMTYYMALAEKGALTPRQQINFMATRMDYDKVVRERTRGIGGAEPTRFHI